VLASVLILMLLVPQIYHIWPERETDDLKQSVEMRSYSSKKWMENKSIKSKSKKNTKSAKRLVKKEKKKKKIIKPEGQIVDIAMPEKEEVPDEAKLVSQYDSKVKKQSKSKHRKATEKVAPKRSKAGKLRKTKKFNQSKKSIALNMQKKSDDSEKQIGRNLVLLPKLKMPLQLEQDLLGKRSKLKSRKGQKAPKQGDADKLALQFDKSRKGQQGKRSSARPNSIPQNLLPSLSSMDTGGAPMSDYLPDVEEGEETWLNTRAFKYATYYNRIKRKVASRWDPVKVQRRYDPSYAIYGYKNRYTVVYIVLTKDGSLENVSIKRSSGVDFLDQEALASIKRSAPFPNPPGGITEKDGKIKFPFGFYFEMTRSGMRLTGN